MFFTHMGQAEHPSWSEKDEKEFAALATKFALLQITPVESTRLKEMQDARRASLYPRSVEEIEDERVSREKTNALIRAVENHRNKDVNLLVFLLAIFLLGGFGLELYQMLVRPALPWVDRKSLA